MKAKFLWAAIVVIILSWLFNYVYFQTKQLEHSVFLKHYYETNFNENETQTQLTFYYLTNKQHPAEVVYNQDQGYFIEKTATSYIQEFRHHYLKSVTVEFRNDLMPLIEPNSVFSFEKMEVFFNNEAEIFADIGKVTIFSEFPPNGPMETRVSSSGNQHRSDIGLVTKEPVTIERISIPFSKEIADDVAVKVNLDQKKLKELEVVNNGGDFPSWYEENRDAKWIDVPGISIKENLFPFQLNANEWIQLNMYINPKRQSYFEFSLRIEGKTEKGEPFVQLAPINDQPYFDQRAVDKLIAEREGDK